MILKRYNFLMTGWNPEKFFHTIPLFHSIPQDLLKNFARKSHRLNFKKGDFIFQEGEPADAAWWVAEGFVKIAKTTPQGRLLTMEMLVKGELFGPTGLMKLARYPANAVAVTKAAVLRVPGPELAALVQDYPSLSQSILTQVSQRLQRAHKLRALNAESADKKVAAALMWLNDKLGDSFSISRREISEIAGVAPETAIRNILLFRKKGWISVKTQTFRLTRPDEIQTFIHQD